MFVMHLHRGQGDLVNAGPTSCHTWYVCCFLQDRNAILADEMGLGKTVQCVSLVGLLAQHMQVRGPFLVVVPLSTVPNWIKEFRKWVPMVSCCAQCEAGKFTDAPTACAADRMHIIRLAPCALGAHYECPQT